MDQSLLVKEGVEASQEGPVEVPEGNDLIMKGSRGSREGAVTQILDQQSAGIFMYRVVSRDKTLPDSEIAKQTRVHFILTLVASCNESMTAGFRERGSGPVEVENG